MDRRADVQRKEKQNDWDQQRNIVAVLRDYQSCPTLIDVVIKHIRPAGCEQSRTQLSCALASRRLCCSGRLAKKFFVASKGFCFWSPLLTSKSATHFILISERWAQCSSRCTFFDMGNFRVRSGRGYRYLRGCALLLAHW